MITSDSLYLVAGTINGEVTAIKAGRSGKTVFNFSPGISGTFTSVLEDTSGYYLAGSSGGDLLVTRLNSEGEEVWTFTESATGEVLNAVILKPVITGFLQ
ncbi:MAG: hypothetical protein R2744_09705 [Bacteroidales bacterium]